MLEIEIDGGSLIYYVITESVITPLKMVHQNKNAKQMKSEKQMNLTEYLKFQKVIISI